MVTDGPHGPRKQRAGGDQASRRGSARRSSTSLPTTRSTTADGCRPMWIRNRCARSTCAASGGSSRMPGPLDCPVLVLVEPLRSARVTKAARRRTSRGPSRSTTTVNEVKRAVSAPPATRAGAAVSTVAATPAVRCPSRHFGRAMSAPAAKSRTRADAPSVVGSPRGTSHRFCRVLDAQRCRGRRAAVPVAAIPSSSAARSTFSSKEATWASA